MATNTSTRPDPTIGKQLPSFAFAVTDSMIDDHFEGLDLERTSFDRGDTPMPSMIAGAADNFHEAARFEQDRGHLWMRQEWDLQSPLVQGEQYVAHARIEDIYRRRDRTVVNTVMTLKDAQGEILLSSKHHQSFLLDQPVEQVQFRDPSKKEGARKFNRPPGSPLKSFDRTVTLEMCGQYFHGSRSYHTDLKASEELGFHNVVVGGSMTMAYIGYLLEQHFGASFWNGGKLDIKFTNPLWPDENISISGIATGPVDDNSSDEGVFAWIEKEDGTIVLIANASAPR